MNSPSENSELTSKKKDYHFSKIEGSLFFIVIIIEVATFIYLIGGQRIVAGHDGFNMLTNYYYFFNNKMTCGEIPQWCPFMMHGTIVTFMYAIGGGLLESIIVILGKVLKNYNYLPCFYAGMFISEFVLLVGVWLLGRRFFSSPVTVFFVTLSIIGSCIWLLQPQYNFFMYYSIPLVLYLFHKFIDTGKTRYYFLSGNLLFIQSFGNLPHFLPVITFVIGMYFLAFSLFNSKLIWIRIRTKYHEWPFIITTLSLVLSFIVLYFFIDLGSSQLTCYGLRNPNGSVSLDQFLTYGGPFEWGIWLELLHGVSACVDYTLYIGVLGVPLILMGLIFNLNRKNIHFFLVVLIVLLFSMGSFVSIFFYHCWPMMKFYRHLVSVSPVIKVFLCFLAGFGFDALFFNGSRWKSPWIKKTILILLSICMLFIFIWLYFLSGKNYYSIDFIKGMVPKYLPFFLTLSKNNLVPVLLERTAVFAFISFILLAGVSVTNQQWLCAKKNLFLLLVTVFVTVHGMDILCYRFLETKLMTAHLDDKMYGITKFQPMPYIKRRERSFWNNTPRAELLREMPEVTNSGSFYSPVHAFLFKDQLGNPFRTDFWMLPLDNYMRAYWGQDINDLSIKPKGLVHRSEKEYPRLDFPEDHPAILKISGVTEDKIQFFSQAEFLPSVDEIASAITDPDYKGDIIFLSPQKESGQNNSTAFTMLSGYDLSANKRLHFAYEIDRFDSNHLMVSTDIGDVASAWLLYSDSWHPLWKATINGKNTPVYKANLAYKAVKLEKGLNEVHFYFCSKFSILIYYFVGINSLFWLIMIVCILWRILMCSFRPVKIRKSDFLSECF